MGENRRYNFGDVDWYDVGLPSACVLANPPEIAKARTRHGCWVACDAVLFGEDAPSRASLAELGDVFAHHELDAAARRHHVMRSTKVLVLVKRCEAHPVPLWHVRYEATAWSLN